jgi:flagellar assembly protein FliH
MNTSCKPVLDRQPSPDVRPFPYADLPAASPVASAAVAADKAASHNREALAQQAMLLEKARQDGETKAAAAFERQAEEMRAGVRAAIADFARERATYYQRVEKEIVELALNIARKILRREAQIDPLLLAGMVRVAVEKIESGTKVTVHVNPDEASECRAYFAQHMEPQQVPEVLEDAQVAMHQCKLETVLGTTELGPEVQLKEIEQGLFDLLGQRPRAAAS